MRLPFAWLLLLVVSLQAVPQQRDTPARAADDAGVLRGTVVASDTGRPVLRAQIAARLSGSQPFRAAATTDISGRFELRLPPGDYIVTASRPGGFLDTQYGQVHPELPGKLVSIQANETREIAIAMMKPGVIAGRVFDEAGDPVPNAGVLAMRQQRSGHRHRFAELMLSGVRMRLEGRHAVSNDRGEYRIFGLEPGEYLLMGQLPATPSSAKVTGRTLDDAQAEGRRRAVPIYFPGVTEPSQAMRLQIASGQEIANADFTLQYVPAIVVEGIAAGPDDVPLTGGSVALYVPGVEGLTALAQNATIQKDGTFRFQALPGQYTLRARHQLRGAPETSRYQGDLSLSLPLTVGEADISGLFLKLAYGAALKGRVQFDQGVQPPPPGVEAKVRVMVESGTPGARVSAKHQEDGTFAMSGIEAGSRRLMASAPAGWILKGVFLNGRDVSDLPIDFQDGVTVENLSILLTNVTSPMTVTLDQQPGGPPAAIAIFPADAATWHALNPRIQFHAASSAPVSIDSLPAGEYLVAAIAEVDAQSLHKDDTKLLERLLPYAERVRLVEGVATTVRVRPVALPQ